MPKNLKTQAQLQAKIQQLEQELLHLRTLLKVILDTAYLAVNSPEKKHQAESSPPEIRPCFNCRKIINLEENQGWKYEIENGRYWCDNCATKEVTYE